MGELALVGEASARGDCRQGELAVAQEPLRPLDKAGSRATWRESEWLRQRYRTVQPAGTIRIEPGGGGTIRLIPSDRTSSSCGVRRKRRSAW
jgi:hypothetical protein